MADFHAGRLFKLRGAHSDSLRSTLPAFPASSLRENLSPPGPSFRGRGLATPAEFDNLPYRASSLAFFVFAIMLRMALFVTIFVSVLKPAEPCRLLVRSVLV